jgi:hypothetical protein
LNLAAKISAVLLSFLSRAFAFAPRETAACTSWPFRSLPVQRNSSSVHTPKPPRGPQEPLLRLLVFSLSSPLDTLSICATINWLATISF